MQDNSYSGGHNTTGNGYIDGIHCDVTNCQYNDKNSKCTAQQISVGPKFAATKSDTVCATFEQDDK